MANRVHRAKKALTILLGQCVPSVKSQASKIRIRRMELDENLLMYFRKDSYVFAHDPKKLCKGGDVVLIKQLPEKLTRQITHSIVKVVYRYGDVIDPISGKPVVVGLYRDEIKATNEAFGKSDSAFDYDKAPPRGRLQGTRDFTHRKTYIKWCEDGNEQPFAV
ncbi:28S ribosomal protein S17, mitochondrial [Pseudolycoriella hygida]|uniref:28S ribosomal protein S17, mitochondrial n=1 Tax=Pseudolycoriella hygida TaxID=35572 RepID=A0A9Q0N1P4_9DIPT|nr:28S ribosomal protein S17, mitochondrial [Pseudolycoriella hygida]